MQAFSTDDGTLVNRDLNDTSLSVTSIQVETESSATLYCNSLQSSPEALNNELLHSQRDVTDVEIGNSESDASSRLSDGHCTAGKNVASKNVQPPAEVTSYDIRRVVFSYSLCCLSTIVSHVMRMPLSTTKVELKSSLNISTAELTYLDNSFSVSYGVGQMASSILSDKPSSLLPVVIHHLVIGISTSLLFVSNRVIYFMIVYAIAGFASGPVWAMLFSHLSSWLPEEYNFQMITFWFTCTDLGYILGGLMCFYVQSSWNWRWSYVVSGLLNIMVAAMLFCLHDENKQTLEGNKLVDPYSVTQRNVSSVVTFLEKLRSVNTNVEVFMGQNKPLLENYGDVKNSDPSSSSTTKVSEYSHRRSTDHGSEKLSVPPGYMYSKGVHVLEAIVQYISVLRRVSYMGRILVFYFILRLVKGCISSWITFYVFTVYNYTTSRGTYLSLIIRLGNCLGNILSALVCKIFWKERPLTACLSLCGMSALSVLSFCVLDFSSIYVASICCCICGISTAAAEAILMAKGIKSICDRSKLSFREAHIVYGFLLAATTVESLVSGLLITYVVDWYGWTPLFSLFVVALSFITALLYRPSKGEV